MATVTDQKAGADGYLWLNNSLLLQWGQSNPATSVLINSTPVALKGLYKTTVTLLGAYDSNVYRVFLTMANSGTLSTKPDGALTTFEQTASSFVIVSDLQPINWITVGKKTGGTYGLERETLTGAYPEDSAHLRMLENLRRQG